MTKKKHRGRPTKYTEEMPDKVIEYINQCVDKLEKVAKTEGSSTVTYDLRLKVNIPTVEGLATFLDVNKTTIYEWEEKHKKFSNALEKLRMAQHDQIVSNGLGGTYNSTIAKLMLMNNFGYKEKSDVTSDDKPLPTPILGG